MWGWEPKYLAPLPTFRSYLSKVPIKDRDHGVGIGDALPKPRFSWISWGIGNSRCYSLSSSLQGPIKPKLLLVSLSGYLGAGTPKEEVPGEPFWLTGAVQFVTQLCADSVSGWGPVLHIFRRKVTQGPPHPWDTPPSRFPPWGLGTQFWAWTRTSASLCTVCP